MKISVPLVNLIFAWIWVLGGFLTGMIMGLKFQDENWLGGYSSEKKGGSIGWGTFRFSDSRRSISCFTSRLEPFLNPGIFFAQPPAR
jgi:hypothetical protein